MTVSRYRSGQRPAARRRSCGVCACSTCFIVVIDKTYGKTLVLREYEFDVLGLAHGVMAASRLGCQLRMGKDQDGLKLYIWAIACQIPSVIAFENETPIAATMTPWFGV
ncbi:hypothetical protein F5Y19DRAFT_473248 [Xylariaceae sp. FL1651]|nr:hypothetical protein F5Y19DRAFT_473248 [Xylariaceae sp. FL1651]